MTVWRDVIGQDPAIATLSRAVSDPAAMTHAWLFTGPPGSGRSVAARAFAAALQCPTGGCGECRECRTAADGTHADVDLIATEGLSIKVEQARDLVALAAHRPSVGTWRVIIVVIVALAGLVGVFGLARSRRLPDLVCILAGVAVTAALRALT